MPSLLQIQEPVRQQRATQCVRYAIGIDLGTTHSLVAIQKENELSVLMDEQGQALLPSVVHFKENNEVMVGAQAKQALFIDADNIISSSKRLMGRSASQSALKTRQGDTNPIEIASHILRILKERAQRALGADNLLGAVITVPAHFDEVQRQMTKQAAQLAGLSVLRLLTEPTAAAIAYGLAVLDGHYLVYDLGGGTFDISLLKCHHGVFQVLATGGDSFLGGDDMDRVLADHIAQKIEDAIADPILLELAQNLKLELTHNTAASVCYNHQTVTVTQSEFNVLIRPLVDKTMHIADVLLQEAGFTLADCRELILVGGATQVPLVQTVLQQWFGRSVLSTLDVSQVVVHGAAKQAAQLAGHSADTRHLLLDVNPLSLGIVMIDGLVEKLILRHAPIPAIATQWFTTSQDNQTGLELTVVQGESSVASECRVLGHFSLKGIPAMPAGQAKIEVSFQMDADGLLQVSAKELLSGTYAKIEINDLCPK